MEENKDLDMLHDGRKLCADAAFEINDIANAAYTMGNEILAKQLSAIAKDVHDGSKMMSDAFSININNQLQETQKQTGDLLMAALDSCLVTGEL